MLPFGHFSFLKLKIHTLPRIKSLQCLKRHIPFVPPSLFIWNLTGSLCRKRQWLVALGKWQQKINMSLLRMKLFTMTWHDWTNDDWNLHCKQWIPPLVKRLTHLCCDLLVLASFTFLHLRIHNKTQHTQLSAKDQSVSQSGVIHYNIQHVQASEPGNQLICWCS